MITATVDISELYDISAAGTYTFQLQTSLRVGGRGPLDAATARAETAYSLASNAAGFRLSAARERAVRFAAAAAFNKCSTSQQAVLNDALLNAQQLALNALGMLAQYRYFHRAGSGRYTTWFRRTRSIQI